MGKKLAIKIDSNEILILEGNYKGKQLLVENCCSLKTPVGSIRGGEIIDMKSLETVIREGLKSNNIKTKNVSVLLNDNQVISRIITLPYVEKKSDVLSMVKYELDQILPIDVTDYSFVYNVLRKFKDDDNDGVEKAEYYVNGSPTSLIDDYRKLMKNVNINVDSINFSYLNLNSIAINSKIYQEDNFSEHLIGFINFGQDNTIFTTLNHGIQDFSRIINNGSKKIVVELSAFFGKTEEEIDIVIKNFYMKGIIETDSNLAVMVRNKYEDLANEIKRYVKYYANNSKGESFIRIYIHGTNVLPKDMYLYMQELLEVECKKNFEISYVNAEKVNDFDQGLYFDHIMALTCAKDTVNLLTIENVASKIKFSKTLLGIIIVVPLLLLIILYIMSQKNQNNEMTTAIDNMNAYMEKKEVIDLIEEVDEIKGENIKYIAEAANLDAAGIYLEMHDIVNTEYILDISRQMPVDTYISQITINSEADGVVIYLQCTSESFTSIAQYEKNLKDIGYYVAVNAPSISKDENYTYVLICTMKEETENED